MTQHQPVPQPAPKKAARPAQPGWTYLAHKLLQRLQDHEDLPESDADATDDPARLQNPTPPALTSRTLLMGLRLAEGIDPARYSALSGRSLDPRRIAILRDEGAIAVDTDGRVRVTMQGFPLLDAVVADLAA